MVPDRVSRWLGLGSAGSHEGFVDLAEVCFACIQGQDPARQL